MSIYISNVHCFFFLAHYKKEKKYIYSRSAVYCAGVADAAGSVTSSGLAATAAVPFLSCWAFRTSAARGWSGSITCSGYKRARPV